MVTLAEELPFAAAIADEHLGTLCSSCFKFKEVVSRCIRCKVVHYCDKDCQQKDWADHKRECSFLMKYSPEVPPVSCRLIARVAIKLERADGQKPAFNGRVFEDLMDHSDEIKKDPRGLSVFLYYSSILREYMGDKVPDSTRLMSIFGKVSMNSFEIMDTDYFSGHALYLGLSAHNHSCAPDLQVVYNGNKAIMRSPDLNMKYSKDLTVTYTDLLYTTPDRQKALLASHYFTCKCARCSDPTLDFLYNSVRSACCPDSYCLLNPDAKEMACFKCGSVSGITVKEAIDANNNVRTFNNNNGIGNKTPAEAVYDVKIFIEAYEKFSKILSPLNLNLLLLNDRLFRKAYKLGNGNPVIRKYAKNLVPVYKHYLPIGSPVLSEQLKGVAISMSHEDPPTRRVLELFEQAFAAYSVSHGPEHHLTSHMSYRLDEYRLRLQLHTKFKI